MTVRFVIPAKDMPHAEITKALTELDTSNYSQGDFNKLEAKKRDKFRCLFCQCQSFYVTVHHKYPKRFGGKDEPKNLITICEPCHKKLEDLIRAASGNSNILSWLLTRVQRTIVIWTSF